MPEPSEIVDVAIIGYGPVGATLANFLGLAGLSVAVLDKELDIYPLPRAIHYDGEIMRVFQDAGLRAEAEAVSRPGTQGMHFVNGEGRTLLIRTGSAEPGPHAAYTDYYFNQPELERVLRNGLKRFPRVTEKTACEVTAVRDEGDFAILDCTTSGGTRERLRARYVVGCDGARSLVRKTIGAVMEDLGLKQEWLVFDVILKEDLPHLPTYSVQHCDPARPMTFCNVVGKRRRWEIMIKPEDDRDAIVRPAMLWKLVERWIKPGQAELERAVIYTFHSVLAQGWRKGRLMLAGDAAHQTPPFLGQGMCAGIRDVANLAWKLEAVLKGRAAPDLLDTYESERAPHVRAFVALAVSLGDIIQITDPEAARARDEKFLGGQPELFPFPSPMLGPGVQDSDVRPVGQPFPQPRLDDGRLLDDMVGNRMAVIGDAALIDAASESTRERWRLMDAVVVGKPGGALRAWLDEQGARAVVLRPDHYLMGMARSAADLDRITARLPLAVPVAH